MINFKTQNTVKVATLHARATLMTVILKPIWKQIHMYYIYIHACMYVLVGQPWRFHVLFGSFGQMPTLL